MMQYPNYEPGGVKHVIFGLCGYDNSGKTTLCRLINELYPEHILAIEPAFTRDRRLVDQKLTNLFYPIWSTKQFEFAIVSLQNASDTWPLVVGQAVNSDLILLNISKEESLRRYARKQVAKSLIDSYFARENSSLQDGDITSVKWSTVIDTEHQSIASSLQQLVLFCRTKTEREYGYALPAERIPWPNIKWEEVKVCSC